MSNPNFTEMSKPFQGKRFSPAEKQAIMDRVKEFIQAGISSQSAVAIMNEEGYRRVDGTLVTQSWVDSKYEEVKKRYRSDGTKHLSGPVRNIPVSKPGPKPSPMKNVVFSDKAGLSEELLEAVMASNLEARHKISLGNLLTGRGL